jgi:hypothetical protein
MIDFACPSCQEVYHASDRQAGSKFACRVCGQRIQVPLPPVGLPDAPRPATCANHSGSVVALVVCLLLGAACVLALAGGLLLLLSPRGSKADRLTSTAPPMNSTGPAGTAVAEPASPAEGGALARQAHDILATYCYRCHGKDGTAEGGLNYVLSRDKLVARKKLVPGSAQQSKLYRRVSRGEMPPEGEEPRPRAAEIAALGRWIDAGAPDSGTPAAAPRSFVADSDLLARILADLQRTPERDRRFVRYFSLAHLANAGLSEDELQTYRHALSKLVNSLSWHAEVVVPRAVDPGRVLLRIDIRDYKWNVRVWQRIRAAYPFGVLPDSPAARECARATECDLPYVRGDWFVATASRPPLYHDVLQLPDTDRKLEEQLHVDVLDDIQQERVARAGFNGSGVSRNNRLLERHESGFGGAYWKSYDFADNVGRHNLFACPLGPGPGARTFEHAGGEIIFALPNGLQGYLLVNGRGDRLDRGPTSIVSDPRRPDRAVENGLSCMACHARGILPKADQVRPHVERNPNAFPPAEAETIKALYPPEGRLRALFEQDAARFRAAVERTGARLTATEPVVALAARFEADLDLPTAAAEVGLTPGEFARRLEESAELARVLGPLKVPGGTVQRQVFTDAFGDIVRVLQLGTYQSPGAARD